MASIFSNDISNFLPYNISVDELTEEDEKAQQPNDINIFLKPHQLTLLKRCIDMENNTIKLKSFKSVQDNVHEDDEMTTRLGVIGDRVGSGKSYVILSLILSNDISNCRAGQRDNIIKSYGMNNVIFKLVQTKKVIKTNLLVIPHNLTNQWTTYISTFSSRIKYLIINKKTITDLLDNKINVEEYDLIMVTSTYYNRFAAFFADKKVKFQRVFYDEVDNLSIPGCRQLDSRFTWLVTASFGNVLYPRGHSTWDPNLHRNVWFATGIINSGHIKNLLLDMWHNVPRALTKLLVAKNDDKYVERSLVLPSIIKSLIKCKTPQSIRILNGIVDRNIIDALNADDVQSAISFISPTNKDTEENIVKMMISKYNTQISNLNLKLDYVNNMIHENESEKQQEIAKINTKIEELQNKIQMIKNRINENDTCCICFDDVKNKTIANCCQNSFCFRCIHIWIAKKPMCPFCKAVMTSQSLFIVDDKSTDSSMQIPEEDPIDENQINDNFDKYKNISILLKNRQQGSKFLIFSNYDSSFHSIYPILNELGIQYEHLKGNGNVIKCMIERYKTGNVDVLLVNSRHYGSGLNLENTSDIIMFHKFDSEVEKQVIGRAHRMGRSSPLNVWYFLYENEMHNAS